MQQSLGLPRLAEQIEQSIDDLVETYERRLEGMDGDDARGAGMRAAGMREAEVRGDLALVAHCLAAGDAGPLVSMVCEQMQGGTPAASLLQRLAALELTLIPLVADVDVVAFLWRAIAQARAALFEPPAERDAPSTLEQEVGESEGPEHLSGLFRSVVDNSLAGIFIVDDQFRFVYANDRLLEIVGSEREDVIGESFQAFLDDESRELVADRYIRRQRGEDVPTRYEFNIVRRDGEKRRVEISSVAIPDRAGRVRTVAQITDITDARRLEQQVEESLARRGRQVQTSTEIAQEIAGAPALEELYRRVVTLVKERFGYYHTQLFLSNRARDRWVSVAGYGEIGARLLEQGYFVAAGTGLVGRAGATGQAVLVADVHDDPEWVYDALLPETQAELAVPIVLREGGQGREVVGVLDVQSDRAGALTEEDVLVLEGLCGQIAIAIESTRLRERMEESLQALEGLYRRASRQGWETFQQQVRTTGYRYDRAEVTPEAPRGYPRVTPVAGPHDEGPDVALERGEDGSDQGAATPVSEGYLAGVAPLSVWGETFGVLGVEVDPQSPLSADDVALLDAVSEQVAQALEGARLFDEEQRARLLLDMRVNELDCLNDVGRRIDAAPPVDELLEWVCGRLPVAMQFPDSALVAIELEDRLYGVAEALQFPWQMVHNLQLTKGKGKICIAYREALQFLDEESALLGDVARRVAGYVENRRLFEQTQRALQETEMLLRLAQGLNQLDDEQAMFEFVLPQYLDVLGLKQGGLLLIDPESAPAARSDVRGIATMGTLKALVRGGQLVEAGIKLPVAGNPAMEQMVTTGKPVVVSDALTSELVTPVRDVVAKLGYRSLLLVPIVGRRGEVVGALGADSTEEVHEFTDREVALVQAVADQLSVTLENRRLLRSTEEALAQSQALYRAASMVAAFESLDSTLQAVVDSVADALAADMVALYRLELDEKKVVDCFQGGPDGEIADPLTFDELWAGLTGWVLRNQEPVLSLKGTADPREDEESRLRRAGHAHGSLIVVPIRYRGEVIGTLTAVNRLERGDFTESDVALMMGLANQAAAAIENARLFDETQRRAEEQALLNGIGRALAACRDEDSLVDQVYAGVAQLLGVDSMYLALYDAEQGEVRHASPSLAPRPGGGEVGSAREYPRGVIDYIVETQSALLLRDRVSERLQELGITPERPGARGPRPDGTRHGWLLREGKEPTSAVGVPISMGHQVLGAILVMNYGEGFGARDSGLGEHEVDLLVALSNDAALALQSVRLLEETRAALAEVEAAHRTYLRSGWEEHLRKNQLLEQSTIMYDRGTVRQLWTGARLGHASAGGLSTVSPGEGEVSRPEVQGVAPRSAAQGVEEASARPDVEAGAEEGEWSTITVPIVLRGQKLGVIGVEVPAASVSPTSPGSGEPTGGEPGQDAHWSEEDYALLEAVSEQLGQTLESARLFADTQRIAERERLIGEITAKIRASTDMRDILETTAVELGRVLGTSRALVRLTASQTAGDVVGQDAGAND